MTVIFDKDDHAYYTEQGRLPSVTQILQGVGLIDTTWFTTEAMERGTLIHNITEQIDKGSPETPIDICYQGYIDAYKKFKADTKLKFEHIEQELAHPLLNYAGTPDRAFPLVDIKTTTSKSYRADVLQLAAYWLLLHANKLTGTLLPSAYFLYLYDDGTYYFSRVKNLVDYFPIWYSVLTVYNYKIKKTKGEI